MALEVLIERSRGERETRSLCLRPEDFKFQRLPFRHCPIRRSDDVRIMPEYICDTWRLSHLRDISATVPSMTLVLV